MKNKGEYMKVEEKSKALLEIVVNACDSKRAEDIVALDVQHISLLADYFVICHGGSKRQIEAIVREVEDQAEKNGFSVKRIEGKEGGKWILVDLEDVIVHVFTEPERQFYNLEKLWSDAPLVNISSWVSE